MWRVAAMKRHEKQAFLSWRFVSALVILCGILGFLQYRWIGEVSLAERDGAMIQRQSGDISRLAAGWFALPAMFACPAARITAGALPGERRWSVENRAPDLKPLPTGNDDALSPYRYFRSTASSRP
jgi:hypothetical protein